VPPSATKPILGIAALGIDDDHRWERFRPQMPPNSASGSPTAPPMALRPWIAKFGGVVYDKRWIPVVEKFYDWHFQNEKYLRNTRNLARVAMVYSQQTGTYYGPPTPRPARVEDHEQGLYHALVEARIPFEMVPRSASRPPPTSISSNSSSSPTPPRSSNAQCEQLHQYVARGGSILANISKNLPLRRKPAPRRPDFGLGRPLRRLLRRHRANRPSKIPTCTSKTQTNHPILRGLEDAGRHHQLPSSTSKSAPPPNSLHPPLTRIPTYPDFADGRGLSPAHPAHRHPPKVFLREVGRSRIAYIPGDPRPHLLGNPRRRPRHPSLQTSSNGPSTRNRKSPSRAPASSKSRHGSKPTPWPSTSSIFTNPMMLKSFIQRVHSHRSLHSHRKPTRRQKNAIGIQNPFQSQPPADQSDWQSSDRES